MSFADKLRELRKAAGLSQPKFAAAADVEVSSVRDYEQGRRIPSWPAIVKIAAALQVSVDTFSACDEVAPAKGKGKK